MHSLIDTFNKNLFVRFVNNNEDEIEGNETVIACCLKQAIKQQFTRDTNIIELYEIDNAQDADNVEVSRENLIVSSAVIPSTIKDLIEEYDIEPDISHGIFLNWAIAHSFMSTVIYLLSNHKEKMSAYINSAIIDGISSYRIIQPNIFDYIIDHCNYDIHINEEYLLSICVMGKNYTMSEYLLERGANIPIGVYRAFQLNHKKFKNMWKLLYHYRERVIGGE